MEDVLNIVEGKLSTCLSLQGYSIVIVVYRSSNKIIRKKSGACHRYYVNLSL